MVVVGVIVVAAIEVDDAAEGIVGVQVMVDVDESADVGDGVMVDADVNPDLGGIGGGFEEFLKACATCARPSRSPEDAAL